jgi:trans-aconitate methyltransferase
VAQYTFGDSTIASERLRIVAEIFEPYARALLTRVDVGPVRAVVDLGCGPGHTTAMLARCFADATVIGIDQSAAYVAEAIERVAVSEPRCRFVVGDVGDVGDVGAEPVPGTTAPADVVYARYLLTHLPDVASYVERWCRALRPGGALVLEEPEHISSTDPMFAAYERTTYALVQAGHGVSWAGALLASMPTPHGMRRVHDETVAIDVTAGEAASMFWRNAHAWEPGTLARAGLDPADVRALAQQLRARELQSQRGLFDWRQRQTIFVRDDD